MIRLVHRLNLHRTSFAYDDEDPPGYRPGVVRVGVELGAQAARAGGRRSRSVPPRARRPPTQARWSTSPPVPPASAPDALPPIAALRRAPGRESVGIRRLLAPDQRSGE